MLWKWKLNNFLFFILLLVSTMTSHFLLLFVPYIKKNQINLSFWVGVLYMFLLFIQIGKDVYSGWVYVIQNGIFLNWRKLYVISSIIYWLFNHQQLTIVYFSIFHSKSSIEYRIFCFRPTFCLLISKFYYP